MQLGMVDKGRMATLFARFRSRKRHTFAEKILSAMRAGFGGHKEPPKAAKG